MIHLGILGSNGRMGQWVSKLVSSEYSASLRLGAECDKGNALNSLLTCDVVIDFSSPEAMQSLAEVSLKHPGNLPVFIVGSTGWKKEELKVLDQLAKKTSVLVASNFSVGVYVQNKILREYSSLLKKIGYTPVLVETHHRHKKDAPSGTALSLQASISPDQPNSVQTHSLRVGEVIGDHEVSFYSVADRIVLGHYAQDRSIFARGAIEVGIWLFQNKEKNPDSVMSIDSYFQFLQKEKK